MKSTAFTYLKWLTKEFTFKESIRDIYDSIAANDYDMAVKYNERVKLLRNGLRFYSKSPKKILDLACGTGAFIEAFRFNNSPEILGVDLSPEMLKVAKIRLKKIKNVSFMNKDFLKLTFPKESFDLITISYSTRFIPKKFEKQFIDNISNWLREDGTFLVVLNDTIPIYYHVLKFIWLYTGYPKGFNLPMNFKEYFVNTSSSHFRLTQSVYLGKKYFFFKAKMLYFEKI